MSKHHPLPDIQSLDSSALLFTANHIIARSMLVAVTVTKGILFLNVWRHRLDKVVTQAGNLTVKSRPRSQLEFRDPFLKQNHV